MLWRVLFVAAVVSYILCVLLLSGVQKEELDEATLRKLQRHNVNIDAIADQKLRAQCLTEKNSVTTLSTTRVNVEEKSTMKPISFELDTQIGASPAQWKKLLAYFKQKDKNESVLKETTMQSIIIQSNNIETLPSPDRSRFNEDIIDPVTRFPQNMATIEDNQKTRFGLKKYDTVNDTSITERSNDVEYISKIVAEIISQRQPQQVKASTVIPTRTFNANKLVQDLDKILEENKRNDNFFRTNFSFNNTSVTEKQEITSDEHKSNTEDREIIHALLNELRNRDKLPIPNVRNSFGNNVETNLDEKRKLTLHNGRDKISDILSISKNEPNGANRNKKNWLYVIDSQSIKPFDSEPSEDQKVMLFNQLNDRDKAFLCKTYNENYSNQKEKYRYKCPNVLDSESSKLIRFAPEEQTISLFNRPNERDKTSYSESIYENYHNPNEVNKRVRPNFFENKYNKKESKLGMEHNGLDIEQPNDRYEPRKEEYPSLDDGYKRNSQFFFEHQRNVEQQNLEGENPNVLLDRPSDQVKATNAISEVDTDKTKNYETLLFPELKNNPKDSNYYKSGRAFKGMSAKEFESDLENKHENSIVGRLNAPEQIMDPNYPSSYRELKNIRPYYYYDNGITHNPNLVNRNSFYELPTHREMFLNNQERMLLKKENAHFNRQDDREKAFELLGRNRSDKKIKNVFEIKTQPNLKHNLNTGPMEYNVNENHNSLIRDETLYTKNNIGSNNYKSNTWPYYSVSQITEHNLIKTEQPIEEPVYLTDSRHPKHNTYEYELQKDKAYNKLLMNAEARSNFYQQYIAKDKLKNEIEKDDKEKVKSLSPDVLRVIADTVKDIVLKDLKKDSSPSTTTSVPKTITTPPITTRTTPIITTTELTTTTVSTPATTPTSITAETTVRPKPTTDTQPTTQNENHVKIQEASKALESFMELFAKFNLMKDVIEKPNVTQTQRNIAQIKDSVTHTKSADVIATMSPMTHNEYAPYQLYAPLLPSINPYSHVRSPYLQSKGVMLDPYMHKIVQIPNTIHNNAHYPKHTAGRSVPALTFQTNSNEIAPLKIPVSKGMIVDNVVLSPKPPRNRAAHLRKYSDEIRYGQPDRYQTQRDFNTRSNRSRDPFNFKFGERPTQPRSFKKEHNIHDRFHKSGPNYEGVRFHEKLEKEDNWARESSVETRCGSKESCNDRVEKRNQRPLISIASTYDDTHFRNFLKTQQKVNDMLERILATKTKHSRRSGEVI